MRSTPVKDLLPEKPPGEKKLDETEVEQDISEIEKEVKNVQFEQETFDENTIPTDVDMTDEMMTIGDEIDSMRSELNELRQKAESSATVTTPRSPPYVEGGGNIFEDVLKFSRIDDMIEIVSLISVYVLFMRNSLHELIDNLIPYIFYPYTPILKGVLFLFAFRIVRFTLAKALKK